MKSFARKEDIDASKEAVMKEENYFLRIPKEKTPWRFLNLEYEDGFVHWYPTKQGNKRVVCSGGLQGKGFAVDDCPICAHVLDLYNEAKELEVDNQIAMADKVRKKANNLHAKAEFQVKALRGTRIIVKVKQGNKYVKQREADFESDDSESSVEAGILSLSEAQFNGLISLIGGEGTEFISNGSDLGKHVLWTVKEDRKGRKGAKFSAVVWSVDAEETDMPDFEVPEELQNLDLSDNFQADIVEISQIAERLQIEDGESGSDEPVEYDDVADSSTDEENEPEDIDLDDIEEDDDDTVIDIGASDLDDIEEDDVFEDDLPDEKVVRPDKATKKKIAPLTSGSKTKRSQGARKSGKTRL